MREFLEQFAALDDATRLSILTTVAFGVVALLRRFTKLQCAPGVASVAAAVASGAVAGWATGGISGAILGALAGLAATGVHQAGKQTAKAIEAADSERGPV
jgi:hypothetical protein